MQLHRFWLTLNKSQTGMDSLLGWGITAYSYEDAIAILRENVFHKGELPKVEKFIEDIDVSSLDERHIIPNMESPNWRGIWYPKGFKQLVK